MRTERIRGALSSSLCACEMGACQKRIRQTSPQGNSQSTTHRGKGIHHPIACAGIGELALGAAAVGLPAIGRAAVSWRMRSVVSTSPRSRGLADHISATTPATCGAAADVPSLVRQPPPGQAEVIAIPGASTSGAALPSWRPGMRAPVRERGQIPG